MRWSWLLLGVLLLDVRSVAAEETCTASGCHAELLSKPHVHAPADSCDSCHEAVSAQHPQRAQKTFKLTQPAAELCTACHDPFKKTHLHGPVSTGACVTCHDPHASENERLLVRKDDALCEGCHADIAGLRKKPHVHGALEGGCVSCHDPHGSDHPKLLADEGAALCLTCHDTIGEKVAAPFPHAALKDPRGCVACHVPHASDQPTLLAAPEKDTCLGCHKTVVTATMTTLHGPIKDGACTPCHDPHGGANPKLLVAGFRTTSYVPYTDTEYALCFSCHKRELVKYPDTSFATGFRDGERNLHFVHVNDARKGRNCTMCHELHGSNQPKLIAVSVPFGSWSLPLKFAKTETGGSCAPGCHAPRSYDRKSPVKKP